MFNYKPIYYYLYFKNKEKILKINNGLFMQNINKCYFFNILFEITFKNNKSDQIELVLNSVKEDYFRTKAIPISLIESNNVEIIDLFFKSINFKISCSTDTKISCFLNCKTKEMVDYYFQNYGDELIGGSTSYKNLQLLESEMLEYFESLLESSGKRIIIKPCYGERDWYKYIPFFNKVILKPSIYSFDEILQTDIPSFYPRSVGYEEEKSIIYFLSNVILNHGLSINYPLDLSNPTYSDPMRFSDPIYYSNPIYFQDYFTPSKTILKFLFHGITKELIQKKLNELFYDPNHSNDDPIELETLLLDCYQESHKENCRDSNTVTKPKKLKLITSFPLLVDFLTILGRIDDIISIITSIPNSLFINDKFSHFSFKVLSTYSMEICMNYFGKILSSSNNNNNLIILSHSFIFYAVERGSDVSIFKNSISSDFNQIYNNNSNNKLNNYSSKDFFDEIGKKLLSHHYFQLFYLFFNL